MHALAQLRDLLVQEGFIVGRKHVATRMRKMGLEEAIARYATIQDTRRPHNSLDRQTADYVYFKSLPLPAAA